MVEFLEFNFTENPCRIEVATAFWCCLTWPIWMLIVCSVLSCGEAFKAPVTKWTAKHAFRQNFQSFLCSKSFLIAPTGSPRYRTYFVALNANLSLSCFLSVMTFLVNSHHGDFTINVIFGTFMMVSIFLKAMLVLQVVSCSLDIGMIVLNIWIALLGSSVDYIPIVLAGINVLFLTGSFVIVQRVKFSTVMVSGLWSSGIMFVFLCAMQFSTRINSPLAVNAGSAVAVNIFLVICGFCWIVPTLLWFTCGIDALFEVFLALGFYPACVLFICICVEMWSLLGDTNCIYPTVDPVFTLFWPISFGMFLVYTGLWFVNEDGKRSEGYYSIRDVARNLRTKKKDGAEISASDVPIFGIPFSLILAAKENYKTLDDCEHLFERFDIEKDAIIFVSHKWIGGRLDTYDGQMLGALVKAIDVFYPEAYNDPTNTLIWIDGLCCPRDLGVVSDWLKIIPEILKLSKFTVRLVLNAEDYWNSAWCVYEAFSQGYMMNGEKQLWVGVVHEGGVIQTIPRSWETPWAVTTTFRRDHQDVMKAFETRLKEIGEDPTPWINLSREAMKRKRCKDDTIIGTIRRFCKRS